MDVLLITEMLKAGVPYKEVAALISDMKHADKLSDAYISSLSREELIALNTKPNIAVVSAFGRADPPVVSIPDLPGEPEEDLRQKKRLERLKRETNLLSSQGSASGI